MHNRFHRASLASLILFSLLGCATDRPMRPRIDGAWWPLAGDPDLGELTGARQQPVDFAIWQAADGTWQLWSCIRGTNCGGNTRLFHRWEGQRLTDPDWTPMGIPMQADPQFGETPGGLQAPHVVLIGTTYHMFYGDWEYICLATSTDGKAFERRLGSDGKAGMFTEGPGANARDAMVLAVGGAWHCYYTAHPRVDDEPTGSVYCRTSNDLCTWSDSAIVARGGQAGSGPWSSECPHVVSYAGFYYLFRTQRYGEDMQTSVYRSKDAMDFGTDDDRCFIGTLPVAAPEIIAHRGAFFIASLMPSLKGIQIARLTWVPDSAGAR